MALNKKQRRERIKFKIRKTVTGTSATPRLSVFRSNSGIYAQLIDDINGLTLASLSSKELGLKSLSVDNSKQVGVALAKKAIEGGISTCVFDRSGYLYHGNVKSLAEGAREGGLKF